MKFYDPTCQECPFHQTVGSHTLNTTRYCSGFPGRKPKRFPRSAPKFKPPKWCPRRLSPAVCRVFGFKDEESEWLEFLLRQDNRKRPCPISNHYCPRTEVPTGLTAKQFYTSVKVECLSQIIPGLDVRPGEVICIDDGLKPYYFYYRSDYEISPLPGFNPTKVR